MSAPRIGVVGDGQLARMMQQAAIGLGVELVVLTESERSAAGQVIPARVVGARDDEAAMRRLADASDVITFEFELLPPELPRALAEEGHVVRPSPAALLCAQDKAHMRAELRRLSVPCPRWALATIPGEVDEFTAGGVSIAKPPRGGYDGKGVREVRGGADVADWLAAGPVLLEERVEFVRELALLFARRPAGELVMWPVVESRQAGGVCAEVLAPAPDLAPEVAAELGAIAELIGPALDITGVCAIEAFELARPRADGARVIVNELALRPHNSGHWTIDGSATSQFEQHLRAVLDWPLGPTTPLAPAVAMVNVLGSNRAELTEGLPAAFASAPGARVELYGKQVRAGRKLGHTVALGKSGEEALDLARRAAAALAGREPEM